MEVDDGVFISIPDDILHHLIQEDFLRVTTEEGEPSLVSLGRFSLCSVYWRQSTWSSVRRFECFLASGPAGDYATFPARLVPPPRVLVREFSRLRYLHMSTPFRSAYPMIQSCANTLETLELISLLVASLKSYGPLHLPALQTLTIDAAAEPEEDGKSPITVSSLCTFFERLNAPMLRNLSITVVSTDVSLFSCIGTRFPQLQTLRVLTTYRPGLRVEDYSLMQLLSAATAPQVPLFYNLRCLSLNSTGPMSMFLEEAHSIHLEASKLAAAEGNKLLKQSSMVWDAYMSALKDIAAAVTAKLPKCRLRESFVSGPVPGHHLKLQYVQSDFFASFLRMHAMRTLSPVIAAELRGFSCLWPSPADSEMPFERTEYSTPLQVFLGQVHSIAEEIGEDQLEEHFDLAASALPRELVQLELYRHSLFDLALKSGRPNLLRRVCKLAEAANPSGFYVNQSVIDDLVARKPTHVVELLGIICQYPTYNVGAGSPLMSAALSLHPPESALPLLTHMLSQPDLFDPNYISPTGETVLHVILSENLPSRSCTAALDVLLQSSFRITAKMLCAPCGEGISALTLASRHPELLRRCIAALDLADDDVRRRARTLRLVNLCMKEYEGTLQEIEDWSAGTVFLRCACIPNTSFPL